MPRDLVGNSSFILKRLQTFEFLHGLDHESLAALAKSAIWKVFPPNAVVFWEGDTANSFENPITPK